jgi:hypothetical protein
VAVIAMHEEDWTQKFVKLNKRLAKFKNELEVTQQVQKINNDRQDEINQQVELITSTNKEIAHNL